MPIRIRMLVLAVLAIIAGYAAAGLYDAAGQARPARGAHADPVGLGARDHGPRRHRARLGRQDIGDTAVALLAARRDDDQRRPAWPSTAPMRCCAAASARAAGNTLIVGAGRVGHLAARAAARATRSSACGRSASSTRTRSREADPLGAVALPVLGASYDLERGRRASTTSSTCIVAFSTAPSHVVLDVVRRCWALGVSVMRRAAPVRGRGHAARAPSTSARCRCVALSPSRPARLAVRGQVRDRPRRRGARAAARLAPLLVAVALAVAGHLGPARCSSASAASAATAASSRCSSSAR